MRPFRTWILAIACATALVITCHGRALISGEQFGYRDSAHFYYPLYERVEREWNEGRMPLWEPEENAGMPLLGNPTAAVLYPGKLIFRVSPTYAWGAKLYVVAHTLLAFLTMFALLSYWKLSGAGCILGSLAYAFGGPILFQYCNIIYLVGAAWLPLGIRAVDRWLTLRDRWALVQLAVVLTMEVLGGDPEMAYLTGLCGGGYALGLSYTKGTTADRRLGLRWSTIGLIGLISLWVIATLIMARVSFLVRPIKESPPAEVLVWIPYVAPTVAAIWGIAGVLLIRRYRKQARANRGPLIPMLAGLAASAFVSGLLSAAQLVPVLEFTAQSGRASGEGIHDIYPFSLEPIRCVEFLWPNLFGTPFKGNRSWLSALAFTKQAKVWVPTLYVGSLTIVFALVSAGLRKGPPWKVWMTVLALASLLLSFGEYTGPLYWARFSPALASWIGPHDTDLDASIRIDRHLRDGDGSLYWLVATVLPGFRQFRFPSKMLALTVLALSALAAAGLDGILLDRGRKRLMALASAFLGLSMVALAGTFVFHNPLLVWLKKAAINTSFGPLDYAGAITEMRLGLIQGAVVLASAIGIAVFGRRRPALAAIVALAVMSADLALANSRYVLTVPQALMEAKPEVYKIIEDAEKANPSLEPYRVHRMPLWNPLVWNEKVSDDRVRDFVVWERDTLQPKYGIHYNLQYTMTLGVAELYDYQWFFGGFLRSTDEENSNYLGVKPGTPVVVYPRRAFDMWNTRYFILPYYPNHWADEYRGFGSMLDRTERVFPPLDAFRGAGGQEKEIAWLKNHDFQVRRNLNVYPRAWVVRSGRFLKPWNGLNRADRDLPMQEILYSSEVLWKSPSRTVYDPRETAWVDQDQRAELAPYLSGGGQDVRDQVKIAEYQPDRVELRVNLLRPGFVILADVYYPGWKLTIDGVDAPIYRANRMMRGAAVQSGEHHLVYSYQPNSLRLGLIASGLGLVLLVASSLFCLVRPNPPTLFHDVEPQ